MSWIFWCPVRRFWISSEKTSQARSTTGPIVAGARTGEARGGFSGGGLLGGCWARGAGAGSVFPPFVSIDSPPTPSGSSRGVGGEVDALALDGHCLGIPTELEEAPSVSPGSFFSP